jgi:hypothetical protein
VSKPQYDTFNFTAHANNVLLLDDIGLVGDKSLLVFLSSQDVGIRTHYSCTFRDDETGKLILSNLKGYRGLGQAKAGSRSFSTRIVEAGKEG